MSHERKSSLKPAVDFWTISTPLDHPLTPSNEPGFKEMMLICHRHSSQLLGLVSNSNANSVESSPDPSWHLPDRLQEGFALKSKLNANAMTRIWQPRSHYQWWRSASFQPARVSFLIRFPLEIGGIWKAVEPTFWKAKFYQERRSYKSGKKSILQWFSVLERLVRFGIELVVWAEKGKKFVFTQSSHN